MARTRILMVDDDPDVRDFLVMVLSEHFDVTPGRDGLEGWKLFESVRPRLVVTDLNMPGMNGMQLTEKIRAHPELAETPVIILTGTTRNSDLPPGFWKIGTGANVFLEKPITPEQLVYEVRRQLLLRAQANPLPPGKGSYGFETRTDAPAEDPAQP